MLDLLGISEKEWQKLSVRFVAPDWEYTRTTLSVLRKCPHCGKIISKGSAKINMLEQVKLENWICKQHGEVTPFHIVT